MKMKIIAPGKAATKEPTAPAPSATIMAAPTTTGGTSRKSPAPPSPSPHRQHHHNHQQQQQPQNHQNYQYHHHQNQQQQQQQRHNQMMPIPPIGTATTQTASPGTKIVRLRLDSGRCIDVFAGVLFREPDSLFADWAHQQNFIDCSHRDARMVRLLVHCMRCCLDDQGKPNGRKFTPPEDFDEWRALLTEAKYWRVGSTEKLILAASEGTAAGAAGGTSAESTITIGYHGTLAAGRGGFEVNFRRVDRILVCGKARACREVFGRFLNETRDWNMDSQRYTSRFYLVHTFVEQAFDALAAHRYRLMSSSSTTPRFLYNMPATGGGGSATALLGGGGKKNSGLALNYDDELSFSHYTQHVFVRYS